MTSKISYGLPKDCKSMEDYQKLVDQGHKAQRQWLSEVLPHWDGYLSAEQARIKYWTNQGMKLQPDGRIIWHGENLARDQDFLPYMQFAWEELSEIQGDSSHPVGGVFQHQKEIGRYQDVWGDVCRKYKYIRADLAQPASPKFFGDKNSNLWKELENSFHREDYNRIDIVFSVAIEDMVFCSDYASFRTCLSINGGEYSGGGRGSALCDNTAMVLRLKRDLVGIDYNRPSIPSTHALHDVLVPKRVGRRWIIGNDDGYMYPWREYGILKWGMLPIKKMYEDNGGILSPYASKIDPADMPEIEWYPDAVQGQRFVSNGSGGFAGVYRNESLGVVHNALNCYLDFNFEVNSRFINVDVGYGFSIYGCLDEDHVVCCECSERIHEDTANEYCDSMYCSSCFSSLFTDCQHCYDTMYRDDVTGVFVDGDEESWCVYCRRQDAFCCNGCGDYYETSGTNSTEGNCQDCQDELDTAREDEEEEETEETPSEVEDATAKKSAQL